MGIIYGECYKAYTLFIVGVRFRSISLKVPVYRTRFKGMKSHFKY